MGGSGSKSDSEAVYQPTPDIHYESFVKDLPSLDGKFVLVTGSTSGTGYFYALAAGQKGATVIMLNRKSDRVIKARKCLLEECPKGIFEDIECDLQSFESVRKAGEELKAKYSNNGIDIFCCNAGVMALADEPTIDGFDIQMQTNHLSHFLLLSLIFPLIETAQDKRNDARIITHSSLARQGSALQAKYFQQGGNLGGDGSSMMCGGARWERYHQTKLANCVFTHALNKRLKKINCNIKSVCAAPGLSTTNLQQNTFNNGGMSDGCCGNIFIMKYAQSAADGSLGILKASFGNDVQSGEFYEPQGLTGIGGLPTLITNSKSEINEKQGDLLWKCSEEAIKATWL
jgi:NAD(P)-dependent dehydrogenase (short-subunit alcohol dehydrogenase family)